jgi:hypothetical protein
MNYDCYTASSQQALRYKISNNCKSVQISVNFIKKFTYQIEVKMFKFFCEKVQIKTLENRVQFIAKIVKICSENILIFNILHEIVSKTA